jgi:dolichol-phosphate mannosyltransferase
VNQTLLLIPTYNEADNIRSVLDQLSDAVPEADILVIDDTSPDGTHDIVRERSRISPQVHLLLREKKEGLARAYLAGFRWGLDRHYQNLVQMDADLSHDPKDVPRLLKALETADVAVGSRYIKGGGTEGWTLPRQFISRGGNVYAQAILGVSYRDLTGGFNAWKRKTLEKIDLATIQSKGYAFQVEMKYRAHKSGHKIVEVPILFKNRIHGYSKMSGLIVREAALRVIQLRTHLMI